MYYDGRCVPDPLAGRTQILLVRHNRKRAHFARARDGSAACAAAARLCRRPFSHEGSLLRIKPPPLSEDFERFAFERSLRVSLSVKSWLDFFISILKFDFTMLRLLTASTRRHYNLPGKKKPS
jgi:hypothetical protein